MLCFRCGSHNPDGSEFCSQCGQKFVDKEKIPPKAEASPEIKLPQRKAESEEKAELSAGTQIAERYEIKSVLGSGPVGTVYRAHDLEIDVDVALKVISPKLLQSREEKKKFLVEIRSARKVNHANVVRLYDEDQDEEYVFYTMQLLEGLSLRKIIRLRNEKSQNFSPKELEPIFSHICQALDRAHEVASHGNLKPENVIVLPDMLKITDFGLFASLPRKPFVAAQKTAQGGYAYLAPELRESEQDVEPSADIYSLGVMLCEMLTGEIYEGPSSGLPRLKPEHEGWLPLIKRALNENPSKRHRSARDFFEEFRVKVPGAAPLKKSTPKPVKVRKSKPPKAPEREKVSFGLDHSDYPPTVVDAETMPDEPDIPTGEVDKALVDAIREVGEDEIIEEIEGEIDSEDVVEAEAEEADDKMEDGETEVVTPIPIVDEQSDLRVAKPVSSSPPTHTPVPKEVRVVERKSTPPKKKERTKTEQVVRPMPQAPYPQPAYGPFSQPPFPPGYSQVPVPRVSRAPLYVFLVVILVAVSIGTYFLVDYLRAQAELARAQASAALDAKGEEKPVLATAPTGEMPKKKPVMEPLKPAKVSNAEEEKKKAEEAEAEAARKAEEERKKAEEARKAEEEKKKADAAMAAALKSLKSSEPAKTHKASRTEKLRKASEEKKRKERERLAEERRRKEEARRREEARKAEEARRRAEARKPAVSKKPRLEEVPEVGTPTPAKPAAPAPPPPPPKKEEKVAIAEKSPAAGKCPRGMVYVPAGKAYIGSATNDPMRNFGEIKLHAVDSQAFCIDRYEYPNAPGKKPSVSISWQAASKACKKRGKRLCTEEEWEYACKGKGNRRFPYGNKWNADTCNTEDANSTDRNIASCGSYPRCRSPFGIFDMSGNVSEWTASKYSPSASARTHKGGSATRPNWATRCASRGNASPGTRKADLGFRCCDDPK